MDSPAPAVTAPVPAAGTIADEARLRAHYPPPTPLAHVKQLARLDAHARRFIALSPFLVLATADAAGRCDASPRGDAPGFVAVEDDHTLLLPDRPGNNRLDSHANIVANPQVGLLFFVPGVDETLRVNGRAAVTVDPDRLAGLWAQGKAPRAALVVRVEEVFFHCGKALRRGLLWDAARHLPAGGFPSLGRVLAEQTGRGTVAEAEARIEHSYRTTLY